MAISDAKSNFRRSMKRAQGLVELNRQLSQRGRPSRELHDVLRGAIVLALASLDALVADVIVEAIPAASRAGKLGKRVEGWVKEEPDRFLDLLRAPDPHRALGESVKSKLAGVTFQRAQMIEDNLRNIIGVELSWEKAGESETPRLDADEIKERLNKVVDRRNEIAHKGDTKGSALTSISRSWVESNVELVSRVGTMIGDSVSDVYGPKRGRPRRSSTRS